MLLGLLSTMLLPSLAAQVTDTIAPGALVLTHIFYPPYQDSLVVPLRAHGVYHVVVWPGSAQVQVVPEIRSAAPVFAVRTREGRGNDATIIELHPIDFAEHAFRVAVPPGTDHVRLWLWEDRAAEARDDRRQYWSMRPGFDADVGVSTAYGGGTTVVGQGPGPTHGPEQLTFSPEINLFVSSGPLSVGFGFNWDPRTGTPDNITWGEIEARAQVIGWGPATHRNAIELVARKAWGNTADVTIEPSGAGGGLLFDHYLTRKAGMRGVRLTFGGIVMHLTDIGTLSPATYLHLTAGISVQP